MNMMEIKCDNDDGTKNWKNRTKIVILTHMMCGGTKRTLLAKIKDNPSFRKMVSKEWDAIKLRGRKRRAKAKKQNKE